MTGSSGLLGRRIVKAAQINYEVVPTHHTRSLFPNSIALDITNRKDVFQLTTRQRPHAVIHVAAMKNVDKCETDRNLAWKTNAEGTRNIAEACKKAGVKLVYVSTDYVFDGRKGLYAEIDKPNPVNYYGLTKLKGEEFVKKYCDRSSIARTSLLYSWHLEEANFASWVVDSLRRDEKIAVINDHYQSPTLTDNIVEALLQIVERDLSGLYHIAGNERINRYEFATRIAETFGLDPSLIKPINMSQLKIWKTRRPRDSSLCIKKAQKHLKTEFLNIEESLSLVKKNQD